MIKLSNLLKEEQPHQKEMVDGIVEKVNLPVRAAGEKREKGLSQDKTNLQQLRLLW